ncbi:hypothetical protein [Microbacterium paludicola]|uniref:hypothetical protein n=1 Tax=Microbacterium paludicola TaxID=300019 RepID=UPI00090381DD|nr:hypothetical protein [Microbacterium paludicola]APF33390.1 hypothetical protein BO218_03560 [Microbacterium paludicola]
MIIPNGFESAKRVQLVLNDRNATTFTVRIYQTNEAGIYVTFDGTTTFYPWHRVSHLNMIKE